MPWSRPLLPLFLLLGSSLAACGGTTTDDVIGSGNPGGSAGSGQAGAGVSGSSGQSGQGGSGGASGNSGQAGAGGSEGCPVSLPTPGASCGGEALSCTYATGGEPCPSLSTCSCEPGGTWMCFTESLPCLPCPGTVNAGESCQEQGVTCGDACGNSCICSGNKWFCDGPCAPGGCSPGAVCTPGESCATKGPDGCNTTCECGPEGLFGCTTKCGNGCFPGAACQPGTACGGSTPDGCVVDCFCTDQGVLGCKSSCEGSCVPGGPCQPGTACNEELPNGCSTGCFCGEEGAYSCKTVCGQVCPGGPQPCGAPCFGLEDQKCTCFEDDQAVPCTCAVGPQGSFWQCKGQPPPQCAPGGPCVGFPCSAETPDGCFNVCECGPGGFYQCKKDCPQGSCAPGASCTPGSECATPQGPPGCTLACTCSPAGLHQCAASCEPGNSCPKQIPPPFSPCPPDGPESCPYPGGIVCFCGDGGWDCVFPP